MQDQARVQVFGDCVRLHPSDLFQMTPAEHSAAAGKKGTIMRIPSRLD